MNQVLQSLLSFFGGKLVSRRVKSYLNKNTLTNKYFIYFVSVALVALNQWNHVAMLGLTIFMLIGENLWRNKKYCASIIFCFLGIVFFGMVHSNGSIISLITLALITLVYMLANFESQIDFFISLFES